MAPGEFPGDPLVLKWPDSRQLHWANNAPASQVREQPGIIWHLSLEIQRAQLTKPLIKLNLDIHSSRKLKSHQSIHCLVSRVHNIHEALVGQ